MIYYLIHIPIIGLLAQLIWLQQHSKLSKTTYLAALLLKLLCGVGLGLLYFNYYGSGDTTSYHHTSLQLTALGKANFSQYIEVLLAKQQELFLLVPHFNFTDQPRAFWVVKVLSVLNFTTGGNYWLNSLYLSTFSFWGMWRLTATLSDLFPKTSTAAAIAFLFYPSVVFWSAGIIKESFLMGAIGLLGTVFLKTVISQNYQSWPRKLLMILFSGWLIFNLKFYYAAVLFPLMLVGGVATYLQKQTLVHLKNKMLWLGGMLLLLGASLYAASSFHSTLSLEVFPDEVFSLYQLSQSGKAGVASFHNLCPTYTCLVQHLPIAVFTGLFRPLPYEAANILQLLASLENAALLIATLSLLAFSIYRWLMKGTNQFPINKLTTEKGIVCAITVLYILIMAWLLTLAFPNFGTQARYRVGYLPLYVYLVCSGLHSLTRSSFKKQKG